MIGRYSDFDSEEMQRDALQALDALAFFATSMPRGDDIPAQHVAVLTRMIRDQVARSFPALHCPGAGSNDDG